MGSPCTRPLSVPPPRYARPDAPQSGPPARVPQFPGYSPRRCPFHVRGRRSGSPGHAPDRRHSPHLLPCRRAPCCGCQAGDRPPHRHNTVRICKVVQPFLTNACTHARKSLPKPATACAMSPSFGVGVNPLALINTHSNSITVHPHRGVTLPADEDAVIDVGEGNKKQTTVTAITIYNTDPQVPPPPKPSIARAPSLTASAAVPPREADCRQQCLHFLCCQGRKHPRHSPGYELPPIPTHISQAQKKFTASFDTPVSASHGGCILLARLALSDLSMSPRSTRRPAPCQHT